jgi:hypothetical protein
MTAPPDGLDASGIRALLVEYQRNQDPQRLGYAAAAVERLVTRPGFDDLDGTARGLVWTLGAAALTWRARTTQAAPDDLDRAIEWSGNAVDAWPADDPNLARARSNLATALTDRYERDGEPADLDRALTLFAEALKDMRARGDRLDVILHSYGCCSRARHRAGRRRGRRLRPGDRAVRRGVAPTRPRCRGTRRLPQQPGAGVAP